MSIQNFDTFAATVSGFKYLPASLATEAITVTAGVLAGYFTWDTVRSVFVIDENACGQFMNLDLPQKVVTVATHLALGLYSAPILEEIAFRGIFQDALLTKAPRAFFGLFGRGHWADALIAKTARIAISAGVFSAAHLVNQDKAKAQEMLYQLAHTLGGGIVLATVKERTGSIWPAVGLHTLRGGLAAVIQLTSLTSCMLRSNIPDLVGPAEESNNSAMPESCKLPENRFSEPVCSAQNQRLIDQAKPLEAQAQVHREKAQASAAEADLYMTQAQSLREQAQSSF